MVEAVWWVGSIMVMAMHYPFMCDGPSAVVSEVWEWVSCDALPDVRSVYDVYTDAVWLSGEPVEMCELNLYHSASPGSTVVVVVDLDYLVWSRPCVYY